MMCLYLEHKYDQMSHIARENDNSYKLRYYIVYIKSNEEINSKLVRKFNLI